MKEELEKLLEEYGIMSNRIFCGMIPGSHMPGCGKACRRGIMVPPLKKFLFILTADNHSAGAGGRIVPEGPDFLDGYMFTELSLPDPTATSFIRSMLLEAEPFHGEGGCTTFREWCERLSLRAQERGVLYSYKECRNNYQLLRRFINDDDKLECLLKAAHD